MKVDNSAESESRDQCHRFLFEEELQAVASGAKHDLTEYEIRVQTRYAGEFDLEHFRFGLWDFVESDGEQYLCFRRAQLITEGPDLETPSETGFYHGGSSLDEFAALFSLHFGSSFEIGRIVRNNDRPRRYDEYRGCYRSETPGRNLTHAQETITHAIGLAEQKKLPFMLALKFYSLGLRQWKTEPEMAFISFVSAIESVAHSHYREHEIGLDDALEGLLAQIEPENLQQNMRNLLWSRSAVKRKVLAFIEDHTTEDFWNDPARPPEEYLRVGQEDFVRLIRLMYDVRSGFLHSGTPPPPVLYRAIRNAEIDSSLGMWIGGKRWDKAEFIPHLSFIARLVQHNLLTFLRRNQNEA